MVTDEELASVVRVLTPGALYEFKHGGSYGCVSLDVFMVTSGVCRCGAQGRNMHQHYVPVIDGRREREKSSALLSCVFALGTNHQVSSARCELASLIADPGHEG